MLRKITAKIRKLINSKDTVEGFYSKTPRRLRGKNLPKGKLPDRLLFITIAFNNSNVIKHQIRLLAKNLTDNYHHIVVDNSSDKNKRNEIKDICIKSGAGYISLHKNPFLNGSGSDSHGAALNWAYNKLVLKYCPKYYGFIDHDIYPVKQHSITEILKSQPFYGLYQEREKIWYLWAGFCFFSSYFYQNNQLDFMPGIQEGVRYDTGGAIYNTAYCKYDKEKLIFPNRRYENLREGGVKQSDQVEIIGEWLHSFNGSYWMKVEDKEIILNELLNKY